MRNLLAIALVVVCAGIAGAQVTMTIPTSIDISMTLTADKVWQLDNTAQTFVNPGATLTIEAGTVIATQSTANGAGSLAVTRGAQINILGTAKNPVIFTSVDDVNTWAADPMHPTGGDPKTGTWRESANEWGNLTIMGDGFIAENGVTGNVPTCDANNVANMEGLVPDPMFPTRTQYGGGNDDDDSGTISYASLRYAGRVIGLGNELNGLSLGGIGRETDIHHVEIMNNVDDGIEIWGGCVQIKYASIWNIGDDSFDIDQGWRGRAQFVLIVQGFSLDASQGSGVGDNCFETDGAEDSDWQPVTTAVIENATVVGQPIDGDHGMAFRDNARVQYHNCVFTDVGDDVVRFDNVDGDGANGYGHNGTLTWAATWTTPFNAVPAHANDCPASVYKAQIAGNLIEVTDSLFQGNNDYSEAMARGVFAAANNNTMELGDSPFRSITRDVPVVRGGRVMQQVIGLDPRLDTTTLSGADAASPVNFNDGTGDFLSYADYKGAFNATENWLAEWTASAAFGFTPSGTATDYLAPALPAGQAGSASAALDIDCALNSAGDGVSAFTAGPHSTTQCDNELCFTMTGTPNQPIVLLASPTLSVGALNFAAFGLPASGQIDLDLPSLVVVGNGGDPGILNSFFRTSPNGEATLKVNTHGIAPGTTLYFQTWVNAPVPTFLVMSNAVVVNFI